MPTTDLEIPLWGSQTSRVHGWCLEAVQEGNAWLQAQSPTKNWQSIRSLLSSVDGGGDTPGPNAMGLSMTGYNKTKRIARELVASLANFRHAGEYIPTQDKALYDRAQLLTQLDANWYQTCQIVERMRKGLQFGVCDGTAYFHQTWNARYWSKNRGDIELDALAASDVTFVQLPKNFNIQAAYATIIREELPLNVARAKYRATNAAFAANLVADRESPGWLQRGLHKVQQFVSPALRVGGRLGPDQNAAFPTVDIFHMYVTDSAINESAVPIDLGMPGTNWAYTVPSRGDAISTGQINPKTGNPFTIPATWDHCALFPLRRYVIFSRTDLCYDNTSPWWHGATPIARMSFGDWAWEALGSSLLGEARTMQQGIEALMRGVEDSMAARLDPPFLYDERLVSRTWAESFNPRKAGSRAQAPISEGKPIEFPVAPEYYNVPPTILDFIEQQERRMDYLTGVTDLVAIAKAQQIPGADTLEKLMEMAGPIVQDLVGRVSVPLTELGEWRKALYFQFYTTARMITVAGEDGAPTDTQYVPEKLIPYWRGKDAQPLPPPEQTQKTQEYLEHFQYRVTESGINEIHRMTTKLFYMQLMKAGFPISWWTYAKVAQIPNFGPSPKETNTEMERWVAQKRIEIEMAVEQQVQAQQGLAAAGMAPQGAPGEEGGEGGSQGKPPGKSNGQAGRPSSFQKPPKMEQKQGPDGPRTTTTTS